MGKDIKLSTNGKIINDTQTFLVMHKYMPIKDLSIFINSMKVRFDADFKKKSEGNTIYFCDKCFSFVSYKLAEERNHNTDLTAGKFYTQYLQDDGENFKDLAKKCGFFINDTAVCPGWTSGTCFDQETENAGICRWGETSKADYEMCSHVFKPLHSEKVQKKMVKTAIKQTKKKTYYKQKFKKKLAEKRQKAREEKKQQEPKKKRTNWKGLYEAQNSGIYGAQRVNITKNYFQFNLNVSK